MTHMDKAQVVERYKQLLVELGEDARDVVLSAGAALVILGIRDFTTDLDVDVSPGTFKWLANSHLIITEEGVSDLIKYRLDVDIHEFDDTIGRVCVDGVWMYSPSELLKQKRHLARMPNRKEGKREADLREADLLEKLIKGQKLTARVMA